MTTGACRIPVAVRNKAVVEDWFFTGIAVTMIAVAAAGFLPSVLDSAGRRAPLSPLAAVHGIVYLAWLILFVVQSRLVASGNVAIHRRVGVAGGFLLALMIPLGYTTTVSMIRRGFDLSGDLKIDRDPLSESVFPLGDLLMFAVLVSAAIAYRQRPEIHKRLMLFGNILLMGPALTHFIGHTPQLARMPAMIILVPLTLFFVAAIVRDYLLAGRVHPLTWGLALSLFLSGPLRAGLIGPSAGWHRLAAWLSR